MENAFEYPIPYLFVLVIFIVAAVLIAWGPSFFRRTWYRLARSLGFIDISKAGEKAAAAEGAMAAKVHLLAALSDQLDRVALDVRNHLEIQAVETERLRREAADAKEVAALNDEALKAAQVLVDTVMERRGRADKTFQIVVAVLSFVGGICATLVITALTGS